MTLKEFINQIKGYGFKIATSNLLVCFTKWYLKAKRIIISYKR